MTSEKSEENKSRFRIIINIGFSWPVHFTCIQEYRDLGRKGEESSVVPWNHINEVVYNRLPRAKQDTHLRIRGF